MKKRQLDRIPNRLINDAALTYSARRVGNALYSKRSRLGQCVMSLAYLAKVSACSIPTVRKAVEKLENPGYICRCRNYQYSEQAGRAFPAIRRIAQLLGMGYATVCRALALLRDQKLALVLHCKKRNHAFSMNSYFMQGRGQRQEKDFVASSDEFLCSLLHSIVDFARAESSPHLLSGVVSFFENCFRT